MAKVDWESLNRKNWDERARLVSCPPTHTQHTHIQTTLLTHGCPQHAASPDYNIQDFLADPNYLSGVVRFDIPLFGDISGLRCVHLQCHIGTDTLSLARRGAASVTGLDFSAASLAEARKLAAATQGSGGEKVDFVEASVYDALDVLPNQASDLVFTGIGALCWIPDIRRWAGVIAGLLRPGGRLFFREGHPMLWALDDNGPQDGKLVLRYPYFERGGQALLFDEGSTYVRHEPHEFENTASAEFSHGIGEIVQALLDAGLRVTGLTEHQSVPWDALPGQMEEIGGGELLRTLLSIRLLRLDDGQINADMRQANTR